MKHKKAILITAVTVVVNILADQLTKLLAARTLVPGEVHSYVAGIIKIIYVENTGAFLGFGAELPLIIKYLIFIIIPLAFCFFGIYYCSWKENDTRRMILFSTIIGGGLGNLIDRIFNQFQVIDFLNFGIGNLRTGILNVADLSVTFGVLLLIIFEAGNTSEQDKVTT